LTGFLSKRRFLFELHSLTRFPSWIHRVVIAKADGVITTNNAKARYLVERYGVDSEKLLVAPNGIDTSEFEKTNEDVFSKYKIDGALPIVLYVGTIDKEYGSEMLQMVAGRLEGKALVVSVGRNKTGRKDKNIRYTGEIPHGDAIQMMLRAGVLVAPYISGTKRNEFYRSSIKVREYMASGVTTVLPRLPAIEEIVDREETYFYEADDVDEFEKMVLSALSGKERSISKSSAARKKANSNTWDSRAQNVLNFAKRIYA